MILSDLFVVRAYSSSDAWAPGKLAMASPPAAPAPAKKPLPVIFNSNPSPSGLGLNRPRQEPANSLAQLQADPLLQAVVCCVSSQYRGELTNSFAITVIARLSKAPPNPARTTDRANDSVCRSMSRRKRMGHAASSRKLHPS